MRRILPILLVAFFLASCTVTVYTHDVPRPHVDVDIREVYTGTLEVGYELNRLLLDFDNSVYTLNGVQGRLYYDYRRNEIYLTNYTLFINYQQNGIISGDAIKSDATWQRGVFSVGRGTSYY